MRGGNGRTGGPPHQCRGGQTSRQWAVQVYIHKVLREAGLIVAWESAGDGMAHRPDFRVDGGRGRRQPQQQQGEDQGERGYGGGEEAVDGGDQARVLRVESPLSPGPVWLEVYVPNVCLEWHRRWVLSGEEEDEVTLKRAWQNKLHREYGPAQASGPSGPLVPMVWSANGAVLKETKRALNNLARKALPDRPELANRMAARWSCGASFVIRRAHLKMAHRCVRMPPDDGRRPDWAEPEPAPEEFTGADQAEWEGHSDWED